MRMVLLAIATGALIGGAAQASEKPVPGAGNETVGAEASETAKKVLIVCSQEERDWRAVSRDLGTPEFVTAKQVRADTSEAWSGPKCITASELRRLTHPATLAAK